MALKRLRTGEMVQLSAQWVTPGAPAREAILATPALAGVLPHIEAAHKALHDTQPGSENTALAKIAEKAAGLDSRHDEIIRGTWWLLSSLAWLSGSGDAAGELLKLRDFLFPGGLDTAQKPYREEAGATDLLRSRIEGDAGVKKQLKEIPVLKKNLAQLMSELVTVGKQLGATEDERAHTLENAQPTDAGKLGAARGKWIRAVNALVANADLAELDEAADKAIFSALRVAEKAADRRKGTSVDTPEEAPPAPDPVAAPPKP